LKTAPNAELDTNAYTGLLAGDETVLDAISGAETIYMSIFVLGELYAGFAGGAKTMENKEILNEFLMNLTVKILNATSETAAIFGFVKNNLRKAGTPIPINDVWIAAHGLESGSAIITYDAHFQKVPGLRIWGVQ
jgi:tRNA(fMet)-specific endonuclease VapC